MSYFIFDELRDLPSKQVRDLHSAVNRHNTNIAHYKRLLLRSQSKQASREFVSRIAYLTKQRDSILNLYPEYFI